MLLADAVPAADGLGWGCYMGMLAAALCSSWAFSVAHPCPPWVFLISSVRQQSRLSHLHACNQPAVQPCPCSTCTTPDACIATCSPPPRVVHAQYGEEALKEGMGGGGGGGMADIFDLFGGGGGRGRARERKSDDVRHNLSVSLEELYNGVTK